MSERPAITLLGWRPQRQHSLRGFAAIRFWFGLVLHDCPVHVTGDRIWAGLPGKPQIDRDGQVILEGGKRKYAPVAEIPDRAVRDRFSDAVVALVQAAHPEDLT